MERSGALRGLLCRYLFFIPAASHGGETEMRALIERVGPRVYPKEPGQPITQLDFQRTEITDDDLAALGGVDGLQVLGLRGCPITDKGLVHLKGLTSLLRINFTETGITDAGLDHLAALPNLMGLDLWRTSISDAGLTKLREFKNLRSLSVKATQVTPEAVEALRQALPDVSNQTDSGMVQGDRAAAERAAYMAKQKETRKTAPARAKRSKKPPPKKDLAWHKREFSSGESRRCVAALNSIGSKRREMGEGFTEWVQTLAPILFEIAENDADACHEHALGGLMNLGETIREAVPASKAAPFLVSVANGGLEAESWRGSALSALHLLDHYAKDTDEAVPLYIAMLKDVSSDDKRHMRREAAQGLGLVGPRARRAAPALVAIARDTKVVDHWDNTTRCFAAEALVQMKADPSQAAPAIATLLESNDRTTRMTGRAALIEMGRPAAPALTGYFTSSDRELKWLVFEILGFMDPKATNVVPELIEAMETLDDPYDRVSATLKDIGSPDQESIRRLVRSLGHEKVKVRKRAASVLGSYGPQAKAALPALKKLMGSDDWELSYEAESADEKIDG